ncbi:hypothetical protein CK203_086214 [Vitis vinifera]|uniref:Retrotransposon Copia-like N-terminal domain-containing protein n=1 Tax=Vitis vinifera TaxID=29760 RepID=A0A438DXM8_VITVI|nr:hypothetical protein CK203_086214 [Vitis vinifera]
MGGQSDSGPLKDCFPNASSMDHHPKNKSMENKYTNNVEAPKFVAKDFASIRIQSRESVTSEKSEISFVIPPSPTENPTIQITTHKLNDQNFLHWAQSVKFLTKGQGKMGLHDGSQKALSLNGEPDQIRSQILGKDPIPSLREVYNAIRREES